MQTVTFSSQSQSCQTFLSCNQGDFVQHGQILRIIFNIIGDKVSIIRKIFQNCWSDHGKTGCCSGSFLQSQVELAALQAALSLSSVFQPGGLVTRGLDLLTYPWGPHEAETNDIHSHSSPTSTKSYIRTHRFYNKVLFDPMAVSKLSATVPATTVAKDVLYFTAWWCRYLAVDVAVATKFRHSLCLQELLAGGNHGILIV